MQIATTLAMAICFISRAAFNQAADGLHVERREGVPIKSLLTNIAKISPNFVRYDTNNALIFVAVPSEYKDFENLKTISTIVTASELKIYGTPSPNTPELRSNSIACLANMTNLLSLEFACFQKGLDADVLKAASKLRQLRKLVLYFSDVPPHAYDCLTNMTQLVELRIIECRNFGSDQLSLLTNLNNLTTVDLDYTSVSRLDTNVLRNCRSLTNVYLAP